MIDLPFEGRKVEGSWKYRRREEIQRREVEGSTNSFQIFYQTFIPFCVCSKICSFHIKTNIAIPTCTSNFSPTSHYPDTQSKNFSLLLGSILLLLPVSYAGQPPTGSTAVSSLTQSVLQRRQQGKRGEDGRESLRCTGRYDNISFNIKTTYCHITTCTSNFSPINNITQEEGSPQHAGQADPTNVNTSELT